jgi:RimJ/RimL family protein N-acetyltransferase
VEDKKVRKLRLRRADERDLDALVSIAIACARSRVSWAGRAWPAPAAVAERSLWWDRLRDPSAWVAVADSGLTRVGCITFCPGGSDPGVAYLAGPLVDPEWWGEGIGRALHAEALAALAAGGYKRAELLIEAGDRRARAFIERLGWTRVAGVAQRSVMTLLPYELKLTRQRRNAA